METYHKQAKVLQHHKNVHYLRLCVSRWMVYVFHPLIDLKRSCFLALQFEHILNLANAMVSYFKHDSIRFYVYNPTIVDGMLKCDELVSDSNWCARMCDILNWFRSKILVPF